MNICNLCNRIRKVLLIEHQNNKIETKTGKSFILFCGTEDLNGPG